jgi:hypothetical protein
MPGAGWLNEGGCGGAVAALFGRETVELVGRGLVFGAVVIEERRETDDIAGSVANLAGGGIPGIWTPVG